MRSGPPTVRLLSREIARCLTIPLDIVLRYNPNMPTSSRLAVAVHTLVCIDVMGGKPVRSEDIARSANTGAPVIRKLLSLLNDAGLTRAQLGAGGGALLAKPSVSIRLLDVYNAVENTEIIALSRTPPRSDCQVGSTIQEAMEPAFKNARSAFENELANVTIADMVDEVARLGKFPVPLSL
jgi:Rrf2 family protein